MQLTAGQTESSRVGRPVLLWTGLRQPRALLRARQVRRPAVGLLSVPECGSRISGHCASAALQLALPPTGHSLLKFLKAPVPASSSFQVSSFTLRPWITASGPMSHRGLAASESCVRLPTYLGWLTFQIQHIHHAHSPISGPSMRHLSAPRPPPPTLLRSSPLDHPHSYGSA